MHPNEVAGSLRLTCKAAAELLADFMTISCREGPVPAHALVWKWSQAEAVRALTCGQRMMLAKRTVETGCLDTVQRLVTGEGGREDVGTLGLALSTDLIAAAAGLGQFAVLQHLRQRGYPWCSSDAAAAAGQGRTDLCLWLLAEGCPKPIEMLAAAASGGHADTCEQLLAAGCPWSAEVAGKAAAGGHPSLMRRLLQLSEVQLEEWPTDVEALLVGAAEGLCRAEVKQLHAQHMKRLSADEAADVGACMLQGAALGCTADYRQKINWLLGVGYSRQQ